MAEEMLDPAIQMPDPAWRHAAILPFARNVHTGERKVAPSQMMRGIANAVTLPRDALAGEVQPYSDEFYERGLGLSLLATPGGVAGTGSKQSVGSILDDLGGFIHQRFHTKRLAAQLAKPNPSTTRLGRMDPRLLDEINKIRAVEKQPAISSRDIRVYEAVLRKFREKRIGMDGLTPEQVANAVYRVVHGKSTTVERGNIPTAQRLVSTEGKGVDVGFVGRGPKDDVSVKSIIRADQERLKRMRKE